MKQSGLVTLTVYCFIAACRCQAPPFIRFTTPVPQISEVQTAENEMVYSCSDLTTERAIYRSWPSHFITPTRVPTDNQNFSLKVNFNKPSNYPVPRLPIECVSDSQLRNGSCTPFYTCLYVMNGTISTSPQCPTTMHCCMLPTCALIIGKKTRYGHCRPKRTCPGIFDTILGVSVGCPDPINAPCCVDEEVTIQCPRYYPSYANALVKAYGLQNESTSNLVAAPQRVLSWAPFMYSIFDDTLDLCVEDCHKTSFLQFLFDIFSEMLMFTEGTNSLYRKILDWKGKSMGLLPDEYFSYFSPSVLVQTVRTVFKSYELTKIFGSRSYISAARIIDFLNKKVDPRHQFDYTNYFSNYSWDSYHYFAKFFGSCQPAYLDGAECHQGQGLCSTACLTDVMTVADYDQFCHQQLSLQHGDCNGYPSNTVCCAKPLPSLKFGANLLSNEFHDMVVAVHQAQFKEPSIISDLVEVITDASAALYRATNGRAFFRTVTIVSEWNNTHGEASYENFYDADVKIVPDYQSEPRVLSVGSCQERGLGVYMSQNHLRQHGSAETFAKLFAMNQWGFGDEFPTRQSDVDSSSCSSRLVVKEGSTLDDIVLIDENSTNSVVSFAYRPDLFPKLNAEFCATLTSPTCDLSRRHNEDPDTPHNLMCNRTSTLSTILQSPDFKMSQNSPRFVGNVKPSFRFVSYPAVTQYVVTLIADFSGSSEPKILANMINAIISFLHIVPDEVPVVLATVGPTKEPKVMTKPIQPLSEYTEDGVSLHQGRDLLIRSVKQWMHFIQPKFGSKNTSVLTGLERVLDIYESQSEYKLRIVMISDFLGIGPTDNKLLLRIKTAGYSIWPISVWPVDRMDSIYKWSRRSSAFRDEAPLYPYAKLLAEYTYGRWQTIADISSMAHWYYALGSYLDDLRFGTPVLIRDYRKKIGEKLRISFQIPTGYGLNTTIIVNYDALLIPVAVNGSFSKYCVKDDRGIQNTFRLACRIGNVTESTQQNIALTFGTELKIYAKGKILNTTKGVTAMVMARGIEHGAAYRGDLYPPKMEDDPWRNRVAQLPDSYVTADVQLSRDNSKLFVVISQGKNALIECPVIYDMFKVLKSSTTKVRTARALRDDGNGADGFANDGIYTAELPTSRSSYSIHVRLEQSNSTNCKVIPGIALVGKANNEGLMRRKKKDLIFFSFYKSVAFDGQIPESDGDEDGTSTSGKSKKTNSQDEEGNKTGQKQEESSSSTASNVKYLGRVKVHSCGIQTKRNSITNFTIFCNVLPLRVDTSITYHLTVAINENQLEFLRSYWSNSTTLIANPEDPLHGVATDGNTGVITELDSLQNQTNGQQTFPISLSMKPKYVSPWYFVLVWATDRKGVYATRSKVYKVIVESKPKISGVTEFPWVSDVTTGMYQFEDTLPAAVIYSCAFGVVLALSLLGIALFFIIRRKPSKRLWERQQTQHLPYGFMDESRVAHRMNSMPRAGVKPRHRVPMSSFPMTSTPSQLYQSPRHVHDNHQEYLQQPCIYSTSLTMDTTDRQDFVNSHRQHRNCVFEKY